jgi:hypothetical protein
VFICLFIQLRTAAFKAYCAILVRRSNFCHQASPRVTTREHPAAEGGTVGEKCPVILPKYLTKLTDNTQRHQVGRDSSVDMATRYRLDGPRIQSRCGDEIFSTCPYRTWGPPNLLYNRNRVPFPGVKRSGRGVDHPPSSGAEVKERVEPYLYSPCGPSWPVLW